MIKLLFAVGLLVACGLSAPSQTYSTHSIGPMQVPTVATDVIVETIKISSVTFSNQTSNPFTIVITDRQPTPVTLIKFNIDGNAVFTWSFPDGFLAKGGVTWYEVPIILPFTVGVVSQINWKRNDATGQ